MLNKFNAGGGGKKNSALRTPNTSYANKRIHSAALVILLQFVSKRKGKKDLANSEKSRIKKSIQYATQLWCKMRYPEKNIPTPRIFLPR